MIVIFLKFIISVRGSHCDLSPRASKILIIPPNVIKQSFAYLLLQEKGSCFARNAESTEIDSENVVKFLWKKGIEVYPAHTGSEFLLKVVESEYRISKFLWGFEKKKNNN